MTGGTRPANPSWTRINDVFHAALEQPVDRRAAYVNAACGADADLHAEVTSLLAAHDRAVTFIERPAIGVDALTTAAIDSGSSLVGQSIGQYRIERVLGQGGMGVVYRAEDTRLGRTVALKALPPRFAGDQGRRDRLQREARVAAALTDAGIATIYALEQFGDQLYIANEYVPGETLRSEITNGPLPLAEAIDTAIAIARALSVAHARGIVHRDLKPENVIRSTNGQIKILDFGLARFSDASATPVHQTEAGTFLGTPTYMAPEQIRRERVDFRADLFAFGILLYELWTGGHPFAGPDSGSTVARILEQDPPALSDDEPGKPIATPAAKALEGIIRTCLCKTPDARFQSTRDLVTALESARDQITFPSRHTPPAPSRRAQASSDSASLWWWQFHQAVVSVGYVAVLYPLWYVRDGDGDSLGLVVFLLGFVAVLVGSTLRLHLWFTLRAYPAEWAAQRRRTSTPVRIADGMLVMTLFAAAAVTHVAHPRMAVLLVGAAVSVLLAFAIIEPATSRAAFQKEPGSRP